MLGMGRDETNLYALITLFEHALQLGRVPDGRPVPPAM
jgi:hypothetical protein